MDQKIQRWRNNSHERKLVENCTCNRCYCNCNSDYLLYMNSDNNSLTIWQAVEKRKVNYLGIAVAACVYAINKSFLITQITGKIGYFCRCYLNDLVCPLFYLGYCQILLLWIGYEIKSFRLCLLLGTISGLIWEYVAPFINSNAVSDPIDIICYFIGTNVYYFFLRGNLRKS